MATTYPPNETVAIARSILGSANGRPAADVLDELQLVLNGATLAEIAGIRRNGEDA